MQDIKCYEYGAVLLIVGLFFDPVKNHPVFETSRHASVLFYLVLHNIQSMFALRTDMSLYL